MNKTLGSELLLLCFQHLSLDDALNARLVCSLWNRVLSSTVAGSFFGKCWLQCAFEEKMPPSPWFFIAENIAAKVMEKNRKLREERKREEDEEEEDYEGSEGEQSQFVHAAVDTSVGNYRKESQKQFSKEVNLLELTLIDLGRGGNVVHRLRKTLVEQFNPLLVNKVNMGSFGVFFFDGGEQYDRQRIGGALGGELCFLGYNDITLLIYATLLEHVELVHLLLMHGASPNIVTEDSDGWGTNSFLWSPLHISAFLGNKYITRLLLFYGAYKGDKAFVPKNPVFPDSTGFSFYTLSRDEAMMEMIPEDIAEHKGHHELAAMLREWPSNVPSWARCAEWFAPKVRHDADNLVLTEEEYATLYRVFKENNEKAATPGPLAETLQKAPRQTEATEL